jgi:hypothetical protein
MAPTPLLFDFDRLALQAADRRVLHAARNETKAIVSLVQWPPASDEVVVVKDLSSRAPWFRLLVGRWLLGREWKALEFLAGTRGVPAPVARVDADAFAMKHCPGDSFLRFSPGELPSSAVRQLEGIVEQMHARGVTHGDLHRDNILLDSEGEVSVIDWATACVFGPHHGGFKAWTWREWQALDLRALAKIKARYAPELLRPDERARLENGGSPVAQAIRRVGTVFKRRAPHEWHESNDKGGLSQRV